MDRTGNFTFIADECSTQAALILESMTDVRPAVSWTRIESGPVRLGDGDTGTLFWSQPLNLSPEPSLWATIPEASWVDLGERTLRAAGIEKVSAEDARNTCLEILSQTFSSLARALGQRLTREISCVGGSEEEGVAAGAPGFALSVVFGADPPLTLWIHVAPELLQSIELVAPSPVEEAPRTSSAIPVTPAPAAPVSQTFDVLLDVELPVSVSFGHTELTIKEVLKLATGSLVELDRTIADPVEVIVNNCVIARGEVVVIECNYGVKIQQIVSRRERLRTGVAHRVSAESDRERSRV